MALQYISCELQLTGPVQQYSSLIEAAILPHGDPIRWAITAVEGNICQVEAVVDEQSSSVQALGPKSSASSH